MKSLAMFATLLALASPAIAQDPAPDLVSRSISIPSEIAPATDLVKRQCAQEREDAIFLSATTLEQLNRTSIEQRKSLVFETLAAVEDNAFWRCPSPDRQKDRLND